jgi:hypothetical protein
LVAQTVSTCQAVRAKGKICCKTKAEQTSVKTTQRAKWGEFQDFLKTFFVRFPSRKEVIPPAKMNLFHVGLAAMMLITGSINTLSVK